MLAAIGEATDDVGFDRAVLGERQRSLGRCVGRAALPARRRASGVIDTHAHLQGLDGGPGAAIEEAAEAGVERIVCVGDSPELAEEAIGLARAHPGVFATVGLHPHRADSGTTRCARGSMRCWATRRPSRWGSAVSTTTATVPPAALRRRRSRARSSSRSSTASRS